MPPLRGGQFTQIDIRADPGLATPIKDIQRQLQKASTRLLSITIVLAYPFPEPHYYERIGNILRPYIGRIYQLSLNTGICFLPYLPLSNAHELKLMSYWLFNNDHNEDTITEIARNITSAPPLVSFRLEGYEFREAEKLFLSKLLTHAPELWFSRLETLYLRCTFTRNEFIQLIYRCSLGNSVLEDLSIRCPTLDPPYHYNPNEIELHPSTIITLNHMTSLWIETLYPEYDILDNIRMPSLQDLYFYSNIPPDAPGYCKRTWTLSPYHNPIHLGRYIESHLPTLKSLNIKDGIISSEISEIKEFLFRPAILKVPNFRFDLRFAPGFENKSKRIEKFRQHLIEPINQELELLQNMPSTSAEVIREKNFWIKGGRAKIMNSINELEEVIIMGWGSG